MCWSWYHWVFGILLKRVEFLGQRLLLVKKDSSIFAIQFYTEVVAQSVRALVCGTRGRGFEPHLPPSFFPSCLVWGGFFYAFLFLGVGQVVKLDGSLSLVRNFNHAFFETRLFPMPCRWRFFTTDIYDLY